MLEPGEVRRLVAEYDVEDALPLSTVESLAFQKLVSKIPVPPSEKMRPTGGVRGDSMIKIEGKRWGRNSTFAKLHFRPPLLPRSPPLNTTTSTRGFFFPPKSDD
ncbi:unnamed protein product [Lepeophtheirus salmonis]|uniref:(salmon louse) hypothetical protein n=1 Tax=Lepeophtheirus salmonis TaxID=72036 RepID=A0A7R8CRF3_LEPSM|nr:unnamed protein product [Lepeophtheirus salmonis]CAF2902375.1 unnamed protein product [Lepeophtheirus salmonis]